MWWSFWLCQPYACSLPSTPLHLTRRLTWVVIFETLSASPIHRGNLSHGLFFPSIFRAFCSPFEFCSLVFCTYINISTLKRMVYSCLWRLLAVWQLVPSSSSAHLTKDFPLGGQFGGPSNDTSFDSFSFMSGDPLDQPVTWCNLLPLQAVIDQNTLGLLRFYPCFNHLHSQTMIILLRLVPKSSWLMPKGGDIPNNVG